MWAGLAAAGALAVAASFVSLIAPRRWRAWVSGAGTALTGLAGAAAGAAAVTGHRSTGLSAPGVLPLSGLTLAVDPLGGWFIAVTGAVAVAAGIYAVGYAGHAASRPSVAMLPLFVGSLFAVPAAASAGTLLACWELMALTSLLLVLAEHKRRAEVAVAARWYAVMTHLGMVCVLAGLILFAAHAHGDSFAALAQAAPHLSPAIKSTVFVLVLAGFGSKAGLVPLHAWLPRAHPEAPSHVSALMSAAMVNLGLYGLIRVGSCLLGGGSAWWWLLLIALGAISAVYGILQAAMSTDVKRLLGCSTTENMGLACVGIGAGGLFATTGHPVLAGLALAAALLHVATHAAFKTLLFLAAGSVLHATGTRDLDALGGLRRGMPATTLAFGWGALAASALPPGTAFVSEWLLVQALIHGLRGASTATAITLPLAVSAVALTAGLAVATFVKAFGTGFLAKPRNADAAAAHESPATMLAGLGLAGAACAVLALAPGAVLPAIGRAVAAAGAGFAAAPGAGGAVTLRLDGLSGEVSPLLLTLALLIVMVGAAAWLRALPGTRARRQARLWDCGGGPLTARMEYTATSFAEPLQRVFDDVLAPETDLDITHLDEARYLVASAEYRRKVPDRIERRLYEPVLKAVGAWGDAARRLAPGSVHRYLGYGFYAVTGLLIVLAVTR
ncbi:hydrogenase 4 subunit B [Trebonia kvetii]|uniref:Hydrogenase 4 subunit B n=1 Tax=Trebonia kvetii TaxID=2480626 RepID=A0A6P2BSS7_9ACTN|nr:hydrogenase 4 subunit B [Trebonia kvetii]